MSVTKHFGLNTFGDTIRSLMELSLENHKDKINRKKEKRGSRTAGNSYGVDTPSIRKSKGQKAIGFSQGNMQAR